MRGKLLNVNRFLPIIPWRVGFASDSVIQSFSRPMSKQEQKQLVTEEVRAGYSVESARRIPSIEYDAFIARLKEVIGGDGKQRSFARLAGVKDSTLRNILRGAWPRTDNLIAISDAGGVTVDWLATGRLPKTRAELRALQEAAARAAVSLDPERLRLALTLAEDAAASDAQPLTPERKADRVLAFYYRLSKGGVE